MHFVRPIKSRYVVGQMDRSHDTIDVQPRISSQTTKRELSGGNTFTQYYGHLVGT